MCFQACREETLRLRRRKGPIEAWKMLLLPERENQRFTGPIYKGFAKSVSYGPGWVRPRGTIRTFEAIWKRRYHSFYRYTGYLPSVLMGAGLYAYRSRPTAEEMKMWGAHTRGIVRVTLRPSSVLGASRDDWGPGGQGVLCARTFHISKADWETMIAEHYE